MKLKCTKHKRRVMVINPHSATHRSDGSQCKSETVQIGKYKFVTANVLKDNWVF